MYVKIMANSDDSLRSFFDLSFGNGVKGKIKTKTATYWYKLTMSFNMLQQKLHNIQNIFRTPSVFQYANPDSD